MRRQWFALNAIIRIKKVTRNIICSQTESIAYHECFSKKTKKNKMGRTKCQYLYVLETFYLLGVI